MSIVLKRAYDEPSPTDGYRVLVDRVWPRGVSREEAKLDQWLKEVAPSAQLRKWFHGDPSRWAAFQDHYRSELESHRDELVRLAQRAKIGRVTLVFGSRDVQHNNAVVLKHYLKKLATE